MTTTFRLIEYINVINV